MPSKYAKKAGNRQPNKFEASLPILVGPSDSEIDQIETQSVWEQLYNKILEEYFYYSSDYPINFGSVTNFYEFLEREREEEFQMEWLREVESERGIDGPGHQYFRDLRPRSYHDWYIDDFHMMDDGFSDTDSSRDHDHYDISRDDESESVGVFADYQGPDHDDFTFAVDYDWERRLALSIPTNIMSRPVQRHVAQVYS